MVHDQMTRIAHTENETRGRAKAIFRVHFGGDKGFTPGVRKPPPKTPFEPHTWERLTGWFGFVLVRTASHIVMALTPSLELDEITRSGLDARLSVTCRRLWSIWNFFTAASCHQITHPPERYLRGAISKTRTMTRETGACLC